jgi:5'-3' exonuclease
METLDKQEKGKLWSIFQHMEKPAVDGKETLKDEVLIVDGLNTFIRSWSVSTTLNDDGIHTGGISGFLKSVGYAIKLFKPVRCVIVFDGAGGSQRRRQIYPDYKNKKTNKIRINRAYADSTMAPELEEKSLEKQLFRTLNYLDCLPVTTMSIDNVEADDTIAYLAQQYFKDVNVIIMSSDKDFIQLVNDRVKVWSPTRKKLYGCAEIMGEYGISCENFINYRVIDGDMGNDNIPGIRGAGLKTIQKCLPIFTNNKRYTIQEILNYCDTHKGKYKLYDTILENKAIMERNYSLMQLNDSIIQSFTQLRINEIVDKKISRLNTFEFIKLIREDKMSANIPNHPVWLREVFSRLDNNIK